MRVCCDGDSAEWKTSISDFNQEICKSLGATNIEHAVNCRGEREPGSNGGGRREDGRRDTQGGGNREKYEMNFATLPNISQ